MFTELNNFNRPTPIQQLNKNWLGNRVFIKREDLLPFSFGGNKARKAAGFFAEIDRGNYDVIMTYGSSSSNHARVVANCAAARGLHCVVVSPIDDKETNTFNRRILEVLGAEIIQCPLDKVSETIALRMEELRMGNQNPYFIQGGGHGLHGTQSYVEAYEEIVSYESQTNLHFDYIFLASGTGTTQAGLIAGQIKHQDQRQIIGISIARTQQRGTHVIEESLIEYFEDEQLNPIGMGLVHFNADYILEGYGSCNAQICEVIDAMLREEGVALDPTYTGKAFWGMRQYLQQHSIEGKNVLFMHTGGTPIFYDYMKER